MSQVITNAGRALLVEKIAQQQPLVLDTVVFAYHDAQQHDDVVDIERVYPDEEAIRAIYPVTRTGYVRADAVAYSVFIDAYAPEFVFNTVYLTHQATQTAFAIETTPTTTKLQTDISRNRRGSNLSRSFVISFDGARDITHIDIPAESWMFNFERATEDTPGMIVDAPHDENVWGRYKNKWVKVWQTGDVKMFSGSSREIEAGWTLADGQGYLSDGRPVPDLRGRFIMAAHAAHTPVDTTGGSQTEITSENGAHIHKVDVTPTVLTMEQLPRFNITGSKSVRYAHDNSVMVKRHNGYGQQLHTYALGGNQPHGHHTTLTANESHTHTVDTTPRYYALAFIIKV